MSSSLSLLLPASSSSSVLVFSSCHAHPRNPSIMPTFALSLQKPLSLGSRFAVPLAPRNTQRFRFRPLSEESSLFSRRNLVGAAATGAGASLLVLANRSRPFGGGGGLENIEGRSYYVVERGDSLSAISRSFGSSVDVIAQANNLRSDTIHQGQTLWIPRMYTIQQGDTLYGIARRYYTTVAAILEINNIEDPNVIKADDVILIP